MRKLKVLLALLLIVPFISICLVGCNENNQINDVTETTTEPEWVKVYSLSYANATSNVTIYSQYKYTYTSEETSQEEYDETINKNWIEYNTFMFHNVQYNSIVENTNRFESAKGRVYFTKDTIPIYKYTITGYEFNYLYIQILDDNNIKIKQQDSNGDDEIKLIHTEYYEITYFNS